MQMLHYFLQIWEDRLIELSIVHLNILCPCYDIGDMENADSHFKHFTGDEVTHSICLCVCGWRGV